ncbi:hypothetical protein JZ751_008603 [Albula glossodonta]|uniref:Tropomodulin n=1 Tax=Albula glossodonta TaxID=121402 RepID=A0A8T2NZE6_9TELE|nr:hypothetical protein JZ751_008603 [Albula glossodonta]
MAFMKKELEKYRDVDEDEILRKLSDEELRELENELDQDDTHLPAGLRQKDQTKKAPTGAFHRDELLAHLEKQAKDHPDKQDPVPYTGEKREKPFLSQLQIVSEINRWPHPPTLLLNLLKDAPALPQSPPADF